MIFFDPNTGLCLRERRRGHEPRVIKVPTYLKLVPEACVPKLFSGQRPPIFKQRESLALHAHAKAPGFQQPGPTKLI